MQEKWKREKKVLELRRIKWFGEIRQLESDTWLGGCGNKELQQLAQRREKGPCKTRTFRKKDEAFTWTEVSKQGRWFIIIFIGQVSTRQRIGSWTGVNRTELR